MFSCNTNTCFDSVVTDTSLFLCWHKFGEVRKIKKFQEDSYYSSMFLRETFLQNIPFDCCFKQPKNKKQKFKTNFTSLGIRKLAKPLLENNLTRNNSKRI